MQKRTYRFALFIYALFFSLLGLNAQTLYPGDINNNGEVTGVDFLYFGLAYGETGPPRNEPSNAWQAQNVNLWPSSFPDGINHAYADANGDGVVNDNDLATTLWPNFGQTLANTTFDGNSIGIENVDPKLRLEADVTFTTPGAIINIDVSLGDANIPVENFYGIAFTLKYNSDRIDTESGVSFEVADNAWIDPTGTANRSMVFNNSENTSTEVAITRIDQNVISSGWGNIGHFSIVIEDDIIDFFPLDTLRIEIGKVRLINNNLETTPVVTSRLSVYINHDNQTPVSECPNTVDPVCGTDGITYLNACYAIAAGVEGYTQGTCFSNCIDVNRINPNANCVEVYDPVCGCNEVTYISKCEAEAAGVLTYTSGPCPFENNCYDPLLVLAASGTSLNTTTGVISLDYQNETENPVCACNGVTYKNAYYAEASGITYYTNGTCEENCVDPNIMFRDPVCPTTYDPVCGCNDITYINDCEAQAAGVTSYTPGACGVSAWCAEAVAIDCGVFLTEETTIGAGNDIQNYPSCLNTALAGPDRVYVFNKTTTGDIQIGLEITTPGLDLDLFLLKGDCASVTCLASSITNNSTSNNEGIVLENAPIGTYYIVVDGQFANSQGSFRLELSCGSLNCEDAIQLTCGQPLQHTTVNGDDNVSLYTCANGVVNVENNGPEVVHTFTLAQGGIVDIQLTNLTANLEMFLLRDCGRGRCLKDSQNPGTSPERISSYLAAGTYYLVVDGYNGASGSYTLSLNCPAECSCGLDINVSATNTLCGQNTGTMVINSTGGNPAYLVSWTGPVSGSFVTFSNNFTITGFPAGVYTVTQRDGSGCSATETVVISDGFSFNTMPIPTACGSTGGINIIIGNGTPSFHVEITGPENRDFVTNQNNINVSGLAPGTYQVYITDANGCCSYQLVTIEEGSSNFNFSAVPQAANCGELGRIVVNVSNGSPTYTVIVSGPASATQTTNSSNFTIRNLPGGTYSIRIIDANNCAETRNVVVQTSDLSVQTSVDRGLCNQASAINLYMTGGTPSYTISWNGPVTGSQTTSNSNYRITNLPNGTYTITTRDVNNCSEYQIITVQNTNHGIDFNPTTVSNVCGAEGSIWLNISSGTAPYTINWLGATSGTGTTTTNGFNIPELMGGNYIISVTDANGCSSVEGAYLNTGSALSVQASADNGCNGTGAVTLNMSNAPPPYEIIWTGPTNGSTSVDETSYTLDLPDGTYAVNVFSVNGCGNVQNVTLNSSGSVDLSFNIQPGTCGQVGSVVVHAENSVGPYQITWQGPVSGGSSFSTPSYMIAGLPTGNYQIQVTAANSCSVTETISINNGIGIGMSTSSTASTCSQEGSINVQMNNGNPPYQVTWNGGESGSMVANSNNFIIPNLSAGNYTIMATASNGCMVEQTAEVENTGNLSFMAQAQASACSQTASIDINITGGMPFYDISWTGPTNGSTTVNNPSYTIQELISGEYVISVTDANNCAYSTALSTETNDALMLDSTPSDVSCHGTNDGSIVVSAWGGTPPYTYAWGNGSTGSEVTQLLAGNYTVTLTDNLGCTMTQMVTIEEPHEITLILNAITPSCNNNDGSITTQAGGGVEPYTYLWSNGSTQPNLSGIIAGTYTLTLTDNNLCEVTRTYHLMDSNQLPEVGFSFTQEALTFNLVNLSNEGNYLWNFGDGTTSTETNPTHVFCEESTFEICLTVTNNCGTNSTCQFVQAAIPSDYVVMEVGTASGVANTTVAVPVTVSNISNLVSIAGSLQVENESIATIEGLGEGIIIPQFNVNNQTFSYYESGGQGVLLNDHDTLFYLLVKLTGTAGNSTEISIVNSPLMIEVGSMVNGTPTELNHATLKGEVSIENNATISGWVETYWGEGINGVNVEVISEDFSNVFITNETGLYQLQDVPFSNDAIIQAFKNTQPDNGISTFSLFMGQRFILGLPTDVITSPYQIIAGDANCSDSFTTLDLFIIQQMIIGARTEFPDCPSWVFVTEDSPMPTAFDAYNVFPYHSNYQQMISDNVTANFIGVKVGDILGQANPQNFTENPTDNRNQDNELRLLIENQTIAAGETFELHFTSDNFNDIVSLQMGLNWDHNDLDFIGFEARRMEDMVGATPQESDNTVRMSWFDAQGIGTSFNESDTLFTVTFTALRDLNTLENSLQIDTVSFQTEAHNSAFEAMDIVLIFAEGNPINSTPSLQNTGYQLYQNVPNPFGTKTTILFDLPAPMEAELIIYNTIGEVVRSYQDRYHQGKNRIDLQKAEMKNGVYYYTLRTVDFAQTKKMTIVQ